MRCWQEPPGTFQMWMWQLEAVPLQPEAEARTWRAGGQDVNREGMAHGPSWFWLEGRLDQHPSNCPGGESPLWLSRIQALTLVGGWEAMPAPEHCG